jgi:hypothetical protein
MVGKFKLNAGKAMSGALYLGDGKARSDAKAAASGAPRLILGDNEFDKY